jgi:transposase
MQKKYSEEFRLEAVRLAQSDDVSTAQVARELGVNANTLYGWIEKYGVKAPEPDGAVEDLASENKRLRRDLKRAQLECEILKKAVSIFSKELP